MHTLAFMQTANAIRWHRWKKHSRLHIVASGTNYQLTIMRFVFFSQPNVYFLAQKETRSKTESTASSEECSHYVTGQRNICRYSVEKFTYIYYEQCLSMTTNFFAYDSPVCKWVSFGVIFFITSAVYSLPQQGWFIVVICDTVLLLDILSNLGPSCSYTCQGGFNGPDSDTRMFQLMATAHWRDSRIPRQVTMIGGRCGSCPRHGEMSLSLFGEAQSIGWIKIEQCDVCFYTLPLFFCCSSEKNGKKWKKS